jgi:hypothetical protein
MAAARKSGRYGHRDATMILIAFRHGLRAFELCDLQWHQVELAAGRLHVRRVKSGTPSVHPLQGDELRALRRLQRGQPPSSHVFATERGGPMTPKGFNTLMRRIGERARMPFPVHPHMLRHACGYALANAGHDTRALQAYLGHKNIQHTVRYSELAPDRFTDFWRGLHRTGARDGTTASGRWKPFLSPRKRDGSPRSNTTSHKVVVGDTVVIRAVKWTGRLYGIAAPADQFLDGAGDHPPDREPRRR